MRLFFICIFVSSCARTPWSKPAPIVPFAHPVPEYIEPDPTPIPDWDNPEVT